MQKLDYPTRSVDSRDRKAIRTLEARPCRKLIVAIEMKALLDIRIVSGAQRIHLRLSFCFPVRDITIEFYSTSLIESNSGTPLELGNLQSSTNRQSEAKCGYSREEPHARNFERFQEGQETSSQSTPPPISCLSPTLHMAEDHPGILKRCLICAPSLVILLHQCRTIRDSQKLHRNCTRRLRQGCLTPTRSKNRWQRHGGVEH